VLAELRRGQGHIARFLQDHARARKVSVPASFTVVYRTDLPRQDFDVDEINCGIHVSYIMYYRVRG
jgi:hypothetical protein